MLLILIYVLFCLHICIVLNYIILLLLKFFFVNKKTTNFMKKNFIIQKITINDNIYVMHSVHREDDEDIKYEALNLVNL